MSIPSITVNDFSELIKTNTSVKLLDVRESFERDICTLPFENQIHISIKELEEKWKEHLNPKDSIVIYCRSGQRSGHATQYLMENGFEKVQNLEGGILEWGRLIDPSCPSY